MYRGYVFYALPLYLPLNRHKSTGTRLENSTGKKARFGLGLFSGTLYRR
jgi:hypothetical protein